MPCVFGEDKEKGMLSVTMQNALGLGQSHGTKLKEFLSNKAITPYINNELAMALHNPIKFIRPGRGET